MSFRWLIMQCHGRVVNDSALALSEIGTEYIAIVYTDFRLLILCYQCRVVTGSVCQAIHNFAVAIAP